MIIMKIFGCLLLLNFLSLADSRAQVTDLFTDFVALADTKTASKS